MLVVPFGRREVLGVVVGLAELSEVAEDKLLAPLRALELGVPAELVALAEWIAAEYCSTIARALGARAAARRGAAAERAQAPRGRRARAIARSARAGRSRRRLTADQEASFGSLDRGAARRAGPSSACCTA